jgi:predicted transglutaminase-like cysteine proteinase
MTKATQGKLSVLSFIVTLATAGLAQAMPANMLTTGATNPPIGHYEFCKSHSNECKPHGRDPGPMLLTESAWKEILQVNYTVNTRIQPMTDEEIYGVEERWAYPTTVGDCEDFVLLKRRMLMQAGMSEDDLLITVVLQPNGEGHAVLTVRTDRGDFILDNMRNKVLLWSDTEYTFIKRQASDDPGRWVRLQDGRATLVGSVKN